MPRSFALGATGSVGPARARTLSGMRRPPPECRSREPLEPCAPVREPRKTGLTQDSSRGLYQCHLPRPLQTPPWRNERGSVDAALRGLPMAIAMRQLREDLRKLLEHARPVVLLPGKQTVECMGSACPWHGWKSRRLAIGRAQRAWQKGVPELGVGYGSGAWQAAAANLAPPPPPRPPALSTNPDFNKDYRREASKRCAFRHSCRSAAVYSPDKAAAHRSRHFVR
jgi:hypothetical protein